MSKLTRAMGVSLKMPEKIKVAIIGAGFGQHVLLRAFQADPRAEVVGISASTLERSKEMASLHGLSKSYSDWKSVIEDEEVRVVAIALPPVLQPGIAKAALRCGKALFLEKPLGVDLREVEELVRVSDETGQAHAVDFEFPELVTWLKAKELIDVSKLYHVSLNWRVEIQAFKQKKFESWKAKARDGGGALHAFGSHALYYLEWFLGPLKEISVTLSNEDTLLIGAAKTLSGVPVSIVISNKTPFDGEHRLEFISDDEKITLLNAGLDYISGFQLFKETRISKGRQLICSESDYLGGASDGRSAAVSKLTSKLLSCIEDGTPCGPTVRDGLRVQKLISYAEESSREGRWISCRP